MIVLYLMIFVIIVLLWFIAFGAPECDIKIDYPRNQTEIHAWNIHWTGIDCK
jgi:hypothetical protein